MAMSYTPMGAQSPGPVASLATAWIVYVMVNNNE